MLYPQEFSDGGEAAAHAHQDAHPGEHSRHRPPDLAEIHHPQQLHGVGIGDAPGHGGIQQPLQAEAHGRANEAQQQALIHERPADEAIGSPHHFHDGDLVPPVEGGELDGVGNDEHGDDQQNGDQGDADDAGDVADGDEAVGDVLVRPDLGDALHALQALHHLVHELQVRQVHHIAVAEDGGVQVAVQVVLVILGHIFVPGLLPGDEGAVRHAGDARQLGLEALGLLIREALVHEGHHGVLLLQVLQVDVGVVGHQREGAHNQQARHGDADGGKGHEPVGQHIAHALPEEITEITHGRPPRICPRRWRLPRRGRS